MSQIKHWLRKIDPTYNLRLERDAWKAMAHVAAQFPETARKAGL